MSYYQTCPERGAHLDPGERCDCEKEKGEESMKIMDDDLYAEIGAADEQVKRIIEKLIELPPQMQKWVCIAACNSEPEYQAMMQTVTKESERQRLMRIRKLFASAREANA